MSLNSNNNGIFPENIVIVTYQVSKHWIENLTLALKFHNFAHTLLIDETIFWGKVRWGKNMFQNNIYQTYAHPKKYAYQKYA